MRSSMNFHPNDNWEKVEISEYGTGEGQCINLIVGEYEFHFHYGDSNNRNDFVRQLKTGFERLSMKCDKCGKEL